MKEKMKKLPFLAAAMAMMALTMTSCQKEEGILASDITFTATTESGNSKTHLEGLNLKWDRNDEIVVMERTHHVSGIYAATSIDGNCATFTAVDAPTFSANDFVAYYPQSIFFGVQSSTADLALPATQNYAESSINGFPMYAVAENFTFHFKNLCGVMRLHLQQSGISVRQIKITTNNHDIWGDFELSQTADAFSINACDADGANHTVTLDCGENGVDISTAKDFNIYLPAGEYNAFDIEIITTDNRVCTKSLNGNGPLNIVRNQITTLTCNGNMNFVSQLPITVIYNNAEVEFTTIYKATYQSMGGNVKQYHLELTDDNDPDRALSIVIEGGGNSFRLSALEYVDEDGVMWNWGDFEICESFSCNAANGDPNTISFDIVGAYMWGGTLRPMDVHADNITFIEGEF